MSFTTFSDIWLAENRLGQGLVERCNRHAAAQDLPDALFLRPGLSASSGMFHVAQSVPRSWQNKANSKSARKSGFKNPPATLSVSPLVWSLMGFRMCTCLFTAKITALFFFCCFCAPHFQFCSACVYQDRNSIAERLCVMSAIFIRNKRM